MNKVFMSGNHAFAEAAIRAGCKCYFGYPITPQNELGEYMADHLPQGRGRVHPVRERNGGHQHGHRRQRTGARAMTSSSSPGISLKQEGISFLAGFELPAGHRERDARAVRASATSPPRRGTTSRRPAAAATATTARRCSRPRRCRRSRTSPSTHSTSRTRTGRR